MDHENCTRKGTFRAATAWEWLLPAADEPLESRSVAQKGPLDRGLILSSTHASPFQVPNGLEIGCIFFLAAGSEKNATEERSARSHWMQRTNCIEEDDMNMNQFLPHAYS